MTRFHRPLLVAGALHLAAVVPALVAMAMDGRLIMGINPWIKPTKFLISIGIYLVTVAWLIPRVRSAARSKAIIAWGVLFALTGEIVLIATQAARGTTSHFNIATTFDQFVFQTMGLLILGNTGLIIWLLMLFMRSPEPMPRAQLAGIRLGLALFLIGSLEASLMIATNGHAVGVPDGGPGLPFVNWSTEGGDLRAAHFVGLHALQALPILGWFLSRRDHNAGVSVVRAVAVAWGLLFAGLTVLAIRAVPLLRGA